MSSRLLISFILLLTVQSTATAKVYRCELADGSVIYGDKPVNLSDACQPMTEDSAQEYLSVQQGTPRMSTPDQSIAADLEAERDAATGTPPESWVERAAALVEDYNDALKRRRRESYLADKRKAMQDMTMIHAEKKELLNELQNSSLSKQDRDDVQEILAEIPEPSP